jgi:hypothetical protein
VISACGSCFDWVWSAHREYTAQAPFLANATSQLVCHTGTMPADNSSPSPHLDSRASLTVDTVPLTFDY